nr:hypothetical protein [uncultured bacterium]
MSEAPAQYRAIQEHIRNLHVEIGAIAAEIGAEAESLRLLADEAAAIAERRSLTFDAVLAAASQQRRTTTIRRIAALTERLADLARAQETAGDLYERLTPEERVGQVPPPTAAARTGG